MNRHSLKVLATVVVVLVLTVLYVERSNDSNPELQGQYLLQGLRDNADTARLVRILQPDSDELSLRRASSQWLVPARDDYAADIGKLGPLIVALAEATILEEKTSNPALYEKLAVDDPENGGSGTKITIEGDDFLYAVVLGDSATGNRRYARIPDEQVSYLVDRNPSLPEEFGDWLAPDIMNIDAPRIRKVSLVHEDGETITIEKSSEDLTDFSVVGIPSGRELSYATVANSIAGALSDLKLEDVRKAPEDMRVESSAVFDTWDGLQITVQVSSDNEDSWLAFSATLRPAAASEDESSTDDEESADAAAATAAKEVSELNARLSGWQYRLPEYRKNQLARRWADLLKSADAESVTD